MIRSKERLNKLFEETRARKERERIELKHMKLLLAKEKKEHKKKIEKKKQELEMLWKKQNIVKL